MNILNFESDYTTGAHPDILKKLTETNMESLSGYGTDKYSESAKTKIKEACGRDDLDVFFLVGGTQTNAVVISSMIADYEGVISAETGHINVHEAGAVEYTGRKILEIPHDFGKITPDKLLSYLKDFYADVNHEHMVFPGMVYISHPTEFGTLYSKSELESISAICHEYNIPLFLDGARLGYGLMSKSTDVALSDIANLCDVFYIGGTKIGALCGEAVVFNKKYTPKHFMTVVKQHGALLAKGRLLGLQFDALFADNLYFNISKQVIEMAEELKNILSDAGYTFAWESPTNQLFVILENKQLDKLKENVKFSYWEKHDEEHTIVRFVTSWSTTFEEIIQLKKYL